MQEFLDKEQSKEMHGWKITKRGYQGRGILAELI